MKKRRGCSGSPFVADGPLLAKRKELLTRMGALNLFVENKTVPRPAHIYFDKLFIRIIGALPFPLNTGITPLHSRFFKILFHRELLTFSFSRGASLTYTAVKASLFPNGDP